MNPPVGLRRKALVLDLLQRMKTAGSWCGETHIQKSAYFLEDLCGARTGYDFVLHLHGPYSYDLHDDLSAMAATGLVRIQVFSGYGPSFEVENRAENVLRRFPRTREQYEKALDFVATRIGIEKVKSLERLATALYVTKRPDTRGDVATRAQHLHSLKPHVSVGEARLAVERVDELIEEATRLRVSMAPEQ